MNNCIVHIVHHFNCGEFGTHQVTLFQGLLYFLYHFPPGKSLSSEIQDCIIILMAVRGRTSNITKLPTTSAVIKKIAAVKWNIHYKNWTKTMALYSDTKAHKNQNT